MIRVSAKKNDLYITGVSCLDLAQTLDCGQAFRWYENADGRWCGVAYGKYLEAEVKNDCFILYNTGIADYESIWRAYFDLDRDYEKIIRDISGNEILKSAACFGGGIRILKQEPWETLCSFILSQNNNIARIKGIISRLCENFGDNLGNGNYTFPDAQRISRLDINELEVLRSGFRAKYVLDAARKVADGVIRLDEIAKLPTEQAREALTSIYGVGDKVADCTLLFGMQRIDAFPKDVWIKRVMEKLFDGALPEVAVPYAGIVQQYLFFYARSNKML